MKILFQATRPTTQTKHSRQQKDQSHIQKHMQTHSTVAQPKTNVYEQQYLYSGITNVMSVLSTRQPLRGIA